MGKGGKRKALPMELIEKKENRMVSFSKRRKGLIKKAEEFHSIAGSSIALIVISEAGRPSVYGAPSFDSLLHRFQSHTHTAPETLLIGDQGGSNQGVNADFLGTHADPDNNVVVVDQGCSECEEDCTTTTTTTAPENIHVAALEHWRTWVDQKIRACQNVDDMMALQHHFSHLKRAADSQIVHSYLKTIENFLVFDL